MYKIISLNVRGLNGSRKRRQVFRWLHQQKWDIILLQATYSSLDTIGRWESEWGGKIVSSHGLSHSRGVMILFKPRLDVNIEKIASDDHGRYILAEIVIDNTKVVLVNVYAPNDPHQQVVFLRGLSNNLLSKYGNENLVLGGDFNCVIGTLDKRSGKPVDTKKASTIELKALIKTHNLLDTWRYKNPDSFGPTWRNPSMKIQCRLDHLFVSNQPSNRICESKIIPNIYSDHSAVVLSISFSEHEPPRGPGFWKFNNSLLSDTKYVESLNFLIPEFAKKHQGTEDKGLFWEMIKMEIRVFTIRFSKKKKQKASVTKSLPFCRR